MTAKRDIQLLDPGTKVELFEVDATVLGGDILYFHPGTDANLAPVVWQGNTYTPWPVEAEGFEWNGRGQTPTPKLRAANVMGSMSTLCIAFADLVGSRVTRRKVLAKYLDGQPGADPTAGFPEDIYFIERKTAENKLMVEWALASAMDVEDVMLPLRQVIANACTWDYRSSECGYAGPAVADIQDAPTGNLAQDRCGKRLVSCKLRQGPVGPLTFGGFPGASKR